MPPRPSTIKRREELLRDALEIVEREYAQPLELEDVAMRISCSRRQLQRAFDEIHGASFRTTLCRIRMRRAARLLAGPEPLSVRQVAARVGYHQPAQFAKAFRREIGMTPSAYRERLAARGGGSGDGRGDPRPRAVHAPAAQPGRVDGFWPDD